MIKPGRVWGCVLEEAYIAINRPLKMILMKAQKRSIEKLSALLDNISVVLNRIFLEMDSEDCFVEGSDSNEEYDTGSQRKDNSWYTLAKNLGELCSCSSIW